MASQVLMTLPSRDESSKEGLSSANSTLEKSTRSSTKPSKYMLVMMAMQNCLIKLCSVKHPRDLHTTIAQLKRQDLPQDVQLEMVEEVKCG